MFLLLTSLFISILLFPPSSDCLLSIHFQLSSPSVSPHFFLLLHLHLHTPALHHLMFPYCFFSLSLLLLPHLSFSPIPYSAVLSSSLTPPPFFFSPILSFPLFPFLVHSLSYALPSCFHSILLPSNSFMPLTSHTCRTNFQY